MPPSQGRWHKPIALSEQRFLHSGAWWLWAIFLAAMAASTTNPFLLLSIIAVVLLVVRNRKSDAPWSGSIKGYLIAAGLVVFIRMILVFITPDIFGDTTLLMLPEIKLPSFFAGVKLGGALKANTLLYAFEEGLRLATILICIGAAQSLASPTRLLKSIPAALYEVGLAIVVALTFAPQLAQDAKRVRDAQYLRGRKIKGIKALAKTLIPVLEGAMERARQLAAAMDSRGYGRRIHQSRAQRNLTNVFILGGLLGILFGLFGLLGIFSQSRISSITLIIGITVSIFALWVAGNNASRSTYRPDTWRYPEFLVISSSFLGLIIFKLSESLILNPPTSPLAVPALSWITLLGVWIGMTAIPFSPKPPSHHKKIIEISSYENYATRKSAA